MSDHAFRILLIALLIVLPLSSLIARRVPIGRVIWMGLSWTAIFAIGFVILTQRAQFDPYLARLSQALDLDDQKVVGGEVRIRMAPDGHFWARAHVDGVTRRMLIDSGATVTALSNHTASEAGLAVHDSIFPMIIQTANGSITAKVSQVEQLRLGDISARDLPVVVSPAFGDTDVLGMNFLSRLKSWRVEGNTLVLVPHRPQPEHNLT
jgi:aspartyl protease family protein